MSYDLRIWSTGALREACPLLTEAGYIKNADTWAHEGEDWQATLSPSVAVESEDIPDAAMQMLPGIAYLTEINIEPISAPEKTVKATLRLCKALAKELNGAVENPQEGTVQLPSGVKKVAYNAPSGAEKKQLSLIWYFDPFAFHQSDKIDRMIDLLELYMPDALPRRYGDYEPPQYKYAETGKSHLVEFLKTCDFPVCYGTKPFLHLFLSVPNPEAETQRYLENGALQPTVDAQSPLGRKLTEYRCGKIELQLLRDAFLQPEWNLAVKRLFAEMSKLLQPFCAEIIDDESSMTAAAYLEKKKKRLIRSWWWRGIPRDMGYALLLNKTYCLQWRRFHHNAVQLFDGFFSVDCFGETALCPLQKKIGSVPKKLAAPRNESKTAPFFPFRPAAALLKPAFDEAAVETLWSSDKTRYAEILPLPDGGGYHFRCMQLEYDDFQGVYYWAPLDPSGCSFFDTPEKAATEAERVLSVEYA